jgi:hypothetical protein
MGYDIGASIGIEGEKEFKNALNGITDQFKLLGSEMKLAVSQFDKNDKSAQALTAQNKVLGKEIDAQKGRISLLTDQYGKQNTRLSELKDKLEESKRAFGADSDEVKKAQKEYDTQSDTVRKLEININNATADLNKMSRKWDDNNESIRTATGSLDGLSDKINGKVNGALSGLYIGLAAVVSGIGVLGKSGIEGASSLEGYRNTLNVVMGDTKKAGETFAWAVDFANKTPFETDSIVEATVKLESYGLKAKEVMPAIGDMAGVMGKDLNDAVEAVADAQTGELERMKEFGITKQMIIDKGNEIMKGKQLVNDKGQIVDQENFNKALFALMDDRFKGGMDLQANSFKGLWSTVTGVFQTSFSMMMGISGTGEVVMGGIFDTIKNKVKGVADTLTKWSTDGTLEKIGATVQSVFNAALDVFDKVYGFVNTKIIPVLKFLWNHIDLVKGIVIGLVVAMAAWKAALVLANVVQEIHNIKMIASAIASGGLAGATTALTAATGSKMGATLLATGAFIAHNIALAASAVAHGVASAAIGVATAAQWLWNAAMSANPIGIIIIAIAALVAAVILIATHWKEVTKVLIETWEKVKKFFEPIAEWFGGIFKKAWKAVEDAFSSVGDFFGGIWDTITGIFKNIGTTIGKAIGGAFKAVVNSIIGFAEGYINTFIKDINFAIGLINKIPGVEIPRLKEINIPKMDVGTRYLPADMLIYAHKGEMIVPRSENPYANSGRGKTLPTGGDEEIIALLKAILKRTGTGAVLYRRQIVGELIPDLDAEFARRARRK